MTFKVGQWYRLNNINSIGTKYKCVYINTTHACLEVHSPLREVRPLTSIPHVQSRAEPDIWGHVMYIPCDPPAGLVTDYSPEQSGDDSEDI